VVRAESNEAPRAVERVIRRCEAVLRVGTRIVHWALVVLMFGLLAAVFLTVLFRYVLHSPLGWSEELGRFVFVWLSFLGMLEGVRLKAHIGIDVFTNALPPGLQRATELFVGAAIVAFLWVVVAAGIRLTAMNMELLSPGLDIPEGWVYLSIPISGTLMAAHILLQMLQTLFHIEAHETI
jgi:TRAP-type C4-dicarboxylate transport system permease small subunit